MARRYPLAITDTRHTSLNVRPSVNVGILYFTIISHLRGTSIWLYSKYADIAKPVATIQFASRHSG